MKACLLSAGVEERNRRLQPWSYLLQAAGTLAQAGHDVCLVSDGYPRLPREDDIAGLPVTRLASLQVWPLVRNHELVKELADLQPDVLFWHLGLTSFFRLHTLHHIPCRVIGVFTSPIYQPQELLRLGPLRLLRGWRLTAVHLLGLMVPGLLLRRALRRGTLQDLVIECETTRDRLVERGLPPGRIHVIRPAIDTDWFQAIPSPAERLETRRDLGYTPEDIVVAFFGPPAPLRGLPALLRATAIARHQNPAIKLLALSRQRDGELDREQRSIKALVQQLGAGPWARLETGFLPRHRLVRTLAACDLVALPFEIVPSDVPLSVLEAMALGLPVITTDLACLPELVPAGSGIRVAPAEPTALAKAIQYIGMDGQRRWQLGEAARERARAWNASCDGRLMANGFPSLCTKLT